MSLYIILMGVQGAGKGVQAQFIKEQYGIPHISTGDLFRAMRTRTDDLAQKVQAIMAAGKLVDDDTTNEVLRDRLEQPDAANGVILDGYPRNEEQAAWLESYLATKNAKINVVLSMKLDLYTAFKRTFGRLTAKNSGSSYNIYYQEEGMDWKWVDDPSGKFAPSLEGVERSTGEGLERRKDDASAGAIIKRIDLYIESTQPLIEYYRKKKLLVEIYADQPISVVNCAVTEAIERAR